MRIHLNVAEKVTRTIEIGPVVQAKDFPQMVTYLQLMINLNTMGFDLNTPQRSVISLHMVHELLV